MIDYEDALFRDLPLPMPPQWSKRFGKTCVGELYVPQAITVQRGS